MQDDDLLNGWKEIAAYLKVEPKTAQRWETFDNLPILRPEKRRKGPVLAKKSALDAWLQGTLEQAVLDDNRLIGLGKGGKILWTYDFRALCCRRD